VEQSDLFGLALGLQQPWTVTRTDFDAAAGRLDLYLDFPRGARFACPVAGCGQGECAVHDTEDKTWRHMDFFQHKAYLHARVPRVRCAEHGVHQVGLSWARPESGFTLLFEALLNHLPYAGPRWRGRSCCASGCRAPASRITDPTPWSKPRRSRKSDTGCFARRRNRLSISCAASCARPPRRISHLRQNRLDRDRRRDLSDHRKTHPSGPIQRY
jgi:hypothetical protein